MKSVPPDTETRGRNQDRLRLSARALAGAIMVGLPVYQAFRGDAVQRLLSMPHRAGWWAVMGITAALQVGLALAAIRGYSAAGRSPRERLIGSADWRLHALVIGGLLLVSAVLVGSNLGGGQANAELDALTAAVLPQSPPEWAAFVGLALVAACCEEVTYRGFLQDVTTAWLRWSPWLVLILVSVSFGAAHASWQQGLAAFAGRSVVGLVLGAIALWRQHILTSVVVHFAVNLTALAVLR